MKNVTAPTKKQLLVISLILIFTAFKADALPANQGVSLSDKRIVEYVNLASAIIYVPNLSRGSLFGMRGAIGKARFTRKTEDNLWCDVSPIRLLVGDFAGTSTGVSSPGPAILFILNTAIADKLAHGVDIISEDILLLDAEQAPIQGLHGIDVLVSGSVSANSGFVLNPGSSILNDIFGASSINNACGHVSADAALTKFEKQN